MYKIIKLIVPAFFIMLTLVSCKGDGKYLSIGEPHFVNDFPNRGELRQIDDFHIDEIGLRSVKVVDTLLFIYRSAGPLDESATWLIYSLDGKKKYEECMKVGRGPGEFTYIPWANSCHFFHKNDSLFVHMPERHKGYLYEMNITKHLKEGGEVPYPVVETGHINSSCWSTTPCGGGRALLNRANDDFTGIQRLMYENDTVRPMPITRDIDNATIAKSDDISDLNLLSKSICYNAAADKFVEAMYYFNQINIYSADGTEGRTICVGNKLDDLSLIENTPRFVRKNNYGALSAWDEGFGAAYLGDSEINLQQLLSNKSQIQFFDWEGNPKYLVELPYQIEEFDIDFTNNVLYVISQNNDKVMAYDATDIIRHLKS